MLDGEFAGVGTNFTFDVERDLSMFSLKCNYHLSITWLEGWGKAVVMIWGGGLAGR